MGIFHGYVGHNQMVSTHCRALYLFDVDRRPETDPRLRLKYRSMEKLYSSDTHVDGELAFGIPYHSCNL